MGSLRSTSSVLYTRRSAFMAHVRWGGSVWDACVALHAAHAWCLQLPCVADLGGWHSAVRFRGSCQLRWLRLGFVCHVARISGLMSAAAMCCGLAVDVCKIGDVCCFPAPAHQPFSSISLDLTPPEEVCSRNVHASGTLKFGYEGVFKIYYTGMHERIRIYRYIKRIPQT